MHVKSKEAHERASIQHVPPSLNFHAGEVERSPHGLEHGCNVAVGVVFVRVVVPRRALSRVMVGLVEPVEPLQVPDALAVFIACTYTPTPSPTHPHTHPPTPHTSYIYTCTYTHA